LTIQAAYNIVVVKPGGLMYFRTSTVKGRTYLLLVEGYRENGKVRQRTIASFGLLEDAISSGKLERLLLSGERYVKKLVLLSEARNADITSSQHKKDRT
jgi:hypothetical protein